MFSVCMYTCMILAINKIDGRGLISKNQPLMEAKEDQLY